MKKAILFAISGVLLLAGCNSQSNPPVIHILKWKGPPYRLAFDTKPAKPDPSGLTIPAINYKANPNEVVTRASLVVHFDTSGVKKAGPVMDQMIMAPTDISGTEGTISPDYISAADKGLARILSAYKMKGKVKLSIALARSSISPQADDAELNSKLLSGWLDTEVNFKPSRAR